MLQQKINVAEPACTGTAMSTCGVPDTTEAMGCSTRPQGTLQQKINVAEPACTGTAMSTCGVPDTTEAMGCSTRL